MSVCPVMRVLLVSSRGISCTLPLRPQLLDRGYRIYSLEAVEDVSVSMGQMPPDAQIAQFTAWRSLRGDLNFIRAVGDAVRTIQPHIVHIDADRRVLGHAMASLLGCRHIPVLVRRGAIGGLNVLNPGDWLCFFGRRRQRLLCTSDAMARTYARLPMLSRLLPPSRLETLHHYVPDAADQLLSAAQARHSLGIPLDCPVVGTICAVRPVKNLLTVAIAIRELRAAFPGLRLVVIGSPGDGREIGRIKSLLGHEGARFPGPLPRARDYLDAFDVFVSPTRAPGEGFGLAIAEAMLAGRAIVASDVGAGPELLGNAGLTAPPLDAGAWRDTIRSLLLDPALRATLGTAARARALETFCADTVADRLAEIYGRALAMP